MIQLRPYQLKAVGDLRDGIATGFLRQVLRADTGSGKTIMFSYMVQQAVTKGRRVLILTDRLELLTQAGGSIAKFGIDVNIIDSKHDPDSFSRPCFVAMAQTLTRRVDRPGYEKYLKEVDLVIIDEAHKTIFEKFFSYFGGKTVVIGATATPIRTGNQPAMELTYQNIVNVSDVKGLIDTGFLVPARSYAVPVDLSNVKTKGNDYEQASLSDFYDDNSLYTGAVDNYKKHAPGSKALLFCSGVKNSIKIRDQFRAAGISAEHLDAENVSKADRESILARFDRGEFRVLCNVGILTTGYDCPSIETVILYRATKSLALFLQMCGRGSRLFENKDYFRVLDFGNNFMTHGLWEAPREWSLSKKKKDKKSLGAQPIKECKSCGALLPAVAKSCDLCGYEFPIIEKKSIAVLLQELDFDESKKHVDRFGWFRHLERKAEIKNESKHWVVRQLRSASELSDYARFKKYNNPGRWVEGVLNRRKGVK